MNSIRETIEYYLLCGVMTLLKLLPERITEGVFRLFGALYFLLSFRRRSMTLQNLKIAFPEMTPRERRGIAWRAFQNMALFMGDSFLVMAGKLTPAKINARVDKDSFEKYREVVSASDSGVLHLSGHLGNWELLANYTALHGFPATVVARRGTNQLIDEKIITPTRTRHGNRIIYKDRAMLNMVKTLRRGGTAAFMIDQKIGKKDGVPVRFFGEEILAVASAAHIQTRFNPRVFLSFMIKTGPREYKLQVSDPVEWTDDGSPASEQIQQLTQRYQSIIEETIRQYPDQWFWMHNRFKLMDARTRRRKKRRAR